MLPIKCCRVEPQFVKWRPLRRENSPTVSILLFAGVKTTSCNKIHMKLRYRFQQKLDSCRLWEGRPGSMYLLLIHRRVEYFFSFERFWDHSPACLCSLWEWLLCFLYVMFTSLSSLNQYPFCSSFYSSATVSIDKSERIVTKFAFIDTILKYPKATKPWHRLRKNRDVLSTYLSFWENSSHRLYVVCQSLIRWGCNRYVACMARQQVFRILEYQIRLVNSKVVLFLLVKFFLRSCIGVDIFFRHGTDDQNGGKIWITFA